jgi:SAM-dependent methyltransferase
MSCEQRVFPESQFGKFTNVDGTISFYLRVNALLKPTDTVLDVGCGRGQYQDDPVTIRRELRILRGKVRKVIGLDVDTAAASNPYLDEFCLLKDGTSSWPVADSSVDTIISDWTLEHVSEPDAFVSEARRVLKPGGYFCARTTNAWSYVALAARAIPERYHGRVIESAQAERKAIDIFPTRYAFNSVPILRRKFTQYGFDSVVYGFAGEPAYLNFSCALYYLACLYERFAPHFLRQSLVIFARKA